MCVNAQFATENLVVWCIGLAQIRSATQSKRPFGGYNIWPLGYPNALMSTQDFPVNESVQGSGASSFILNFRYDIILNSMDPLAKNSILFYHSGEEAHEPYPYPHNYHTYTLPQTPR